MYYVTINGRKMPTPYRTLTEAMQAVEEYQARLGPGYYDIVYDSQG